MPSFDPFAVVSTSNSSSISIVNNGTPQVSNTYDVYLRATREGTFTIGPARVTVNGRTYESNSVKVSITRQAQENATALGSKMLKGFISARSNDPNINKEIRGRLFLYTEMSKTDVVPYEPIIARTYIYKAPGLVEGEQYGFTQRNPPSSTDYLRLGIARNTPHQWEPVKVGSTTFQRALVEEAALIPTKTGNFDYRSSAMAVALPVRGRGGNDAFNDPFGDPFASFFGRNRVTAELPPPPRDIHVHPLPEPQPKDFSGIVGDFTVKASVDRPEAKEGEIVTYSLVFSGRGYADAIPDPVLPVLDGFTLFDKKSQAKSRATENGVEGRKSFQYLLRAAKPGTQRIPSQEFVLFNPDEGRYIRQATDPITVHVKPGEQNAPIQVASGGEGGANNNEIRQLGSDIAHIHTGSWKPAAGLTVALYTRPTWWFLQAVPLLMLVAALVVRKRRHFYEQNPDLVRQGRAGAEAERRLRKAKQYLTSQQSDRFYSEVALAVRGFLGDKLGREPSGLTTDEIGDLLTERGVDEALRSHTVHLLDACDAARYSLGSDAPGSRQSTYDEAAQVLRRLREALS